ncbi:hypothetical protein K227x_29200 [Rubripirellula lacrimiformis]|uniref:Cna protein B-type domain protein n=1 Tax=Rubripirellula lacrimiformis TaxID=1930273 RepID=A0A517NBZ3_9BACT|nr:hypothetical protein [Rubripirellula lacrimiformis]QDT04528.1 hypothetical protein K227x_29200 [Rubripirellula lacrimiformis]
MKIWSQSLAALMGCLVLGGTALADNAAVAASDATVVTTTMQDEVDQLPADNVAYFAANRQVKVKLDLLAALQDEKAELENALVTVVRPDGTASDYVPNADGIVTIDNVQKGVHALTSSSDRIHGTIATYFTEQQGVDQADPLALANQPAPLQMTMLKVKSDDLRSAIDNVRGLTSTDSGFGGDVNAGQAYNYRVSLGDDGLLRGRIVLLTRDSSISAGGVDVTIYFNGRAVGSTVSDDQGNFQMSGLRSGVHGIVASGPAGFAAFAFEAIGPSDVAMVSKSGQTLVAAEAVAVDVLPVVLVPPKMVQPVVDAITRYYPNLNEPLTSADGAAIADAPVGAPIGPMAGGFSPAPYGSSPMGGGGGGFSGGGAGGGSGLIGLAGLGVIGAVIATTSDDDNNAITPPQPVSPALP